MNHLTTHKLTEKCQAEAERYQQNGQSDERYCLELFRRALLTQDETAWAAIEAQYRPLVNTWVLSYSRFGDAGEEAAFFVNEVFARMWEYASRPGTAETFVSLGSCLQYLKMCVWSAIENHIRRQKKDALIHAIPLNENSYLTLAQLQPKVDEQAILNELSQLLWQTTKNKREQVVAEESWIYDSPPRQIQVNYPELFATVSEVSQVKRNIIKRLKRKLRVSASR